MTTPCPTFILITEEKELSDKELEVVVVPSYVDLDDDSFNPISNFYIINSLGDYYFIKTRSRTKAEQWITDNYGKGFFKLRTMKIERTDKPLSVRGTATR